MVAKFFPNFPDMNVDRSVNDDDVVPPDLIKQHLAREYFARVLSEKGKDIEFLAREENLLRSQMHRAVRPADVQPSRFNHRLISWSARPRLIPTEQRLDPCCKLPWADGLANIVIRPKLEG